MFISLRRSALLIALLGAPVALASLSVAPPVAQAQAVVSTGQSFIQARLVPGAPAPGGGRMAGLDLTLADGWKTYWRSPGETGVPPVFDWSGSTNLRAVEVLWPRPELFVSFGTQTVGYANQVTLPLRLVPEDPADPMDLRLKAGLGVCRELCVLEEIRLDATIAPGDTAGAGQIARAMERVPVDGAAGGLTAAHCRIVGAGPERRLEASLSFARPLDAPVVLIEGPETAWIGGTEAVVQGGELIVTATVEMLQPDAWIDRGDLRLTVLDGAFATDIRGCAGPGG